MLRSFSITALTLSTLCCIASEANATDAAYREIAAFNQPIYGVLAVSPTTAYVTAGSGRDAGLYEVSLVDGTVTPLQLGLPLGTPGRMVLDGDTILLADWNSEVDVACCGGRVFRYDIKFGIFTPVYDGNVLAPSVGDPIAIAPSPGGPYGDGVFVLDFQGASADPPFIGRILDGPPSFFAIDAAIWTPQHSPVDIVFAPAGGPYTEGAYVTEWVGPGADQPGVWYASAAGALSQFAGVSAGSPFGLEFAGGCGTTRMLVAYTAGSGGVVSIAPDGTTEATVISDLDMGLLGSGVPDLSLIDDSNLLAAFGTRLYMLRLCAGDLNNDCVVDTSDLLTMLGAWGTCNACVSDLDGDDLVGTTDLLKLLGGWGACR